MGTQLVDPRSKYTQPEWLKLLQSAVGTVNGRPFLPERFQALPAEHRATITERLWSLSTILEPMDGDDERKAFSLTKLQAVLGNPAIPETFAEIRASVYLDALADIPAWAVEEAAMHWVRGEGLFADDNPVFVPKPAQIIRLARHYMRPYEHEQQRLQRVSEALQIAKAA